MPEWLTNHDIIVFMGHSLASVTSSERCHRRKRRGQSGNPKHIGAHEFGDQHCKDLGDLQAYFILESGEGEKSACIPVAVVDVSESGMLLDCLIYQTGVTGPGAVQGLIYLDNTNVVD